MREPQVDSLRVEDAGNYTCTARNAVSVENLSQSVRLIVQCKLDLYEHVKRSCVEEHFWVPHSATGITRQLQYLLLVYC